MLSHLQYGDLEEENINEMAAVKYHYNKSRKLKKIRGVKYLWKCDFVENICLGLMKNT